MVVVCGGREGRSMRLERRYGEQSVIRFVDTKVLWSAMYYSSGAV